MAKTTKPKAEKAEAHTPKEPVSETSAKEKAIKYNFETFSESYKEHLKGLYKDSKSELSFKEWLKEQGY